jgi:glucose-6-phosphate isomerase
MSESPAPLPYPESEKRLRGLAAQHESVKISDLLDADPARTQAYTVSAASWTLDYSRQWLNDAARDALFDLAGEAGLDEAREGLFDGRTLNRSENRPALHCLLRATDTSSELAEKLDEVRVCRRRMAAWVDRVHGGEYLGFSDEPVTDIVNLGIGGSDLGPRMVVDALRPWHKGAVQVHFCANIDPADLSSTLSSLNPARTLFIICSKTLTTEETLHNARKARAWLADAGADDNAMARHFLAVSTNLDAAASFGIPTDNILPLWDWVGGRFSLWSAIGWSIAFAIGNQRFEELLAGAEAMDAHFRTAPLSENMAVCLSLLEIWNVNFLGAENQAVVPYSHDLRGLPAFLQQLSMESNGKRVNREGHELGYDTAPVLWGAPGSNAQHSFHQLLHQGTALCPVDFILPMRACEESDPEGQERLVANCLAQARALLIGKNRDRVEETLLGRGYAAAEARQLAPHLVVPGNRPSSTLSCATLDPQTLGGLIALYEHKVFCSGHIWDINSFDQWGVELGKQISGDIYTAMSQGDAMDFDPSTDALLARYRNEQ